MTLEEAFAAMADDRELTERFTEQPKGVLQELGVDTSDLIIEPLPGGTYPHETFKAAVDEIETEESATICVSVGAIVCVSVGKGLGADPK